MYKKEQLLLFFPLLEISIYKIKKMKLQSSSSLPFLFFPELYSVLFLYIQHLQCSFEFNSALINRKREKSISNFGKPCWRQRMLLWLLFQQIIQKKLTKKYYKKKFFYRLSLIILSSLVYRIQCGSGSTKYSICISSRMYCIQSSIGSYKICICFSG